MLSFIRSMFQWLEPPETTLEKIVSAIINSEKIDPSLQNFKTRLASVTNNPNLRYEERQLEYLRCFREANIIPRQTTETVLVDVIKQYPLLAIELLKISDISDTVKNSARIIEDRRKNELPTRDPIEEMLRRKGENVYLAAAIASGNPEVVGALLAIDEVKIEQHLFCKLDSLSILKTF